MDHLACPVKEVWKERQKWFEATGEKYQGIGSYLVSDQACALIADVQSAFCAGAWLAVIVLSLAVVDAQLRETELPGFKGNTKKLLKEAGANSELQKLRLRRNKLIHIDTDNPAITVDQQWEDRKKLEREAKKAVKLMFDAFYMNPGT